jgi:hypothetical protein
MFVYGLTQILDTGFDKMVSYVLFRTHIILVFAVKDYQHMNKFMTSNHELLPLIQVNTKSHPQDLIRETCST